MKVALVKMHENSYSEARDLHLAFILAAQMILILNVFKVCQVRACVCKYHSILLLHLQYYIEKTLILKQQLYQIQSYHTKPQDNTLIFQSKYLFNLLLFLTDIQLGLQLCFSNASIYVITKIHTVRYVRWAFKIINPVLIESITQLNDH